MKFALSVVVLSMILISSVSHKSHETIIGEWGFNVLILNGDTIFHRDNMAYSINYNLKMAHDFSNTLIDSARIIEGAKLNFETMRNVRLSFLKENQFSMTKTRSGGRIELGVFDTGVYELNQDSIFITVNARNNYEMLLLFDKFANRIFFFDGVPEHMVFTEYVKLDEN